MNKNESKYFNTAKKIDDSFLSFLEKKDFEYITVKDVCARANVNRSTFYLHYENLIDLVEEIIETTKKDFKSYFENTYVNVQTLSKEDLYFIDDKYLSPYLKYIKEYKKLYTVYLNNEELFKKDIDQDSLYKNIINKIVDKYNCDKK